MDVKPTIVDSSVVMLENNRYRDEIVEIALHGDLLAGTLLSRSSEGHLVPFTEGEENRPCAVVGYDLNVPEAGKIATRVIIAGGVRKEKLKIHGDKDDSKITNIILDKLRDFGIYALDCNELGVTK